MHHSDICSVPECKLSRGPRGICNNVIMSHLCGNHTPIFDGCSALSQFFFFENPESNLESEFDILLTFE